MTAQKIKEEVLKINSNLSKFDVADLVFLISKIQDDAYSAGRHGHGLDESYSQAYIDAVNYSKNKYMAEYM